MLQTKEEVGTVENGVDSPNAMSISSVASLPLKVDVPSREHKSSDSVSNPVPEVKEREAEKKEEKKEITPAKEEEKKPAESEVKPESDVKHEPEVKDDAKFDHKDALQKRFDDLTKKRRTAERERDFERDQRLKLEEELKKLKSKIPSEGKPKAEDFESQEEFIEALATWTAERKFSEQRDEYAKAVEEKKAKEEIYSANESLDEALTTGREKYGDFDQVVLEQKDLPFTQPLVDIILDSEIAEEIMYYLAKNSDDLEDISKLSTRRAAREVALIEAKLLSVAKKKGVVQDRVEPPAIPAPKLSDSQEGATPVKKVTNAPDPITPLRTTGMAEKDPNQMTPKEYRAWRERDKR